MSVVPGEGRGLNDVIWEVHKFGGTSVADASCFLKVASIIHSYSGEDKQLAIVVSAMGGKPKVTDLLLESVRAAAERCDEGVQASLQLVVDKHMGCIKDLPLSLHVQQSLVKIVQKDIEDIRDILKTVSLMKWQASRISELISGYGETWSSQILTCLLNTASDQKDDFEYLDARRFIIIDENDGNTVCWDTSLQKLKTIISPNNKHFVITGYVASNTDGVATTLQRDGSDFSAAITGYLLKSSSINIWTDVDGVLSADPRRVPQAYVLPELSFNEAMELAYFGAKVIHPKTMQPALMANIPIYIKNTFQSHLSGSRIFTTTSTDGRDKCVVGFSSIENMALVNIEGSGMVGVKGVARRLFGTLESAGVNVVLISQASSEHSITFATTTTQATYAKTAIEEEFHKEIKQNHISEVAFQAPCSIIAAVGDGMHTTTGVSGKFFSALGDAKINILAISQGSSERNISAVVLESESTRALRAVHAAFRLSETTVRIGIVGINDIGISLLQLLQSQKDKLKNTFDIDLQVVSVLPSAESKTSITLKHHTPDSSITYFSYNHAGDGDSDVAQVVEGDLKQFKDFVISEDTAHSVIFDCTADETVGNQHIDWLRSGIHVVTANNTALSGSNEVRKKIRRFYQKKYLCEVTVGGGLPIISTLRDLLHSGDSIEQMDGILSVSMSYIMHRISPPPGIQECQTFDATHSIKNDAKTLTSSAEPIKLSQALKEAMELGLTEDDPSRDIHNEFTARCLMVLANELSLDALHSVESIQEYSDKIVDNFCGKITEEMDEHIATRVREASKKNCVLRHVSRVDVKTGNVSIQILEVPNTHVFATTPPSNECVRFFTHRHSHYPLIIQGPSAGTDSTASALLAEVLHLMKHKRSDTGIISRTTSSTMLF